MPRGRELCYAKMAEPHPNLGVAQYVGKLLNPLWILFFLQFVCFTVIGLFWSRKVASVTGSGSQPSSDMPATEKPLEANSVKYTELLEKFAGLQAQLLRHTTEVICNQKKVLDL